MQAIPALFAGLTGTAVAAGTVAAGTAAVAATSAATMISTASAVITGIGALASSMYKAKVASNNARIADSNAQRAVQEAAIRAQDGDITAQGEMGQLIAQGGASGLSLGTGSLALQRKAASELAARDRGYTTYAGAADAAGYRQQAQDFRSEAAAERTGGFMNLIGSALDIKGSLISGATATNASTARSIGSTPITGATRRRIPGGVQFDSGRR